MRARARRTNPWLHAPERYKARIAVERGMGWLTRGRRVTTAMPHTRNVAWVFCT